MVDARESDMWDVVKLVVSSLVVALAVGCETPDGSDESEPTNEEPSAEKGEPKSGDESAREGEARESGKSADEQEKLEDAIDKGSPIEKERLLEAARTLQGNWVTGGLSGKKRVAWNVEGASLTIYDGSEEKTRRLSIFAPCRTEISYQDEDGTTTQYYTFAIDGDEGYAGSTVQAGVVTSDGFIICSGNDIHVKTESGCTIWKRQGFSWDSSESECSMEGNEVEIDAADSFLERAGDIVVDDNPDEFEIVSYPSFEKAKAAIDE